MMKRLLFLVALCMLGALLAGCSSGWKAKIVDSVTGRPVKDAEVWIWVYTLNENPYSEGKKIADAYDRGETLQGWKFATNKNGQVTTKPPTGGYVVDSYTPQRTVTTTEQSNANVNVYGSDGSSAYGYGSGTTTKTTTVPGQVTGHWVQGNWLAVTVKASGYRPYHFVFRPDTPSGNLGTIKLQAL